MGNLREIKYLIVDVDGTMTDSGLYYDDHGNEFKRFSTRDGESIKLAKSIGIKIIVVTGRKCGATKRRMQELHIDICKQGVLNKYEFIGQYLQEQGIKKEELGYIGDDINDLKAMSLAGFVGCPADSCREVKAVADYVGHVNGGFGAVRDVIEYILRERDEWKAALNKAYSIIIP